MRRRLSVLLLAGVALVAAGCGGSARTTTVNVPVPPSGTGTGATPGGSSSTASSTTTTTTPADTTPACVATDLSLSYLGGQGATGHGELGFALKNTSAHACHTYGYPGVLFLDRQGDGLTTVSHRTTRDFFGRTPKLLIHVEPGTSVSFRLGVTHGMTSTAGCTTAYGLQVIAPDDTNTLRVQIPTGAYECGAATVSPVMAADTAYP
jgi:hypothetical protein